MSTGNSTESVGMPTAETKYYTTGSIVVAIISTVVAAIVLSLAYGPADHYSPLVYLNIILAYGFAYVVGMAGRRMLRAKKINSLGAATLVGGIGGLAALFFGWVSYVWTLAEFDFSVYFNYLTHPHYIWYLMEYLSEDPMWTLGQGSGSALPAILYYFTWLVEAGIVIIVPMSVCRTFVRDNVLCDGCGEWIAPTGDTAVFDLSQEADNGREQRVRAGDLAALLELPRLDPSVTGVPRMEAVGLACPYCEDRDSFATVIFVVEKEGKARDGQKARHRQCADSGGIGESIVRAGSAARAADRRTGRSDK